ncbi:hypothetical protein ElyMa_005054300 [Elysia marginata]|uniref:Shugoshin C-terminal domain-containing protein n=1 Tax=Elysia marginata TaxID=1093978 RepID=A0AAV4JCH0_9GAST|nr:hypothetical protein ElyMa_005054300 [Elysia marginata]
MQAIMLDLKILSLKMNLIPPVLKNRLKCQTIVRAIGSSQSAENIRSESSMDWSLGANDSSSATTASCAVGSVGDEERFLKEETSRTDPGPDRKRAKSHSKKDNGSATPCSRKKVVFDLRKNRANSKSANLFI